MSLGFELSPQLVKLGPTYSKQISNERADLLDLDVVAWIGAKADIGELEKDRTYTQLPALSAAGDGDPATVPPEARG